MPANFPARRVISLSEERSRALADYFAGQATSIQDTGRAKEINLPRDTAERRTHTHTHTYTHARLIYDQFFQFRIDPRRALKPRVAGGQASARGLIIALMYVRGEM